VQVHDTTIIVIALLVTSVAGQRREIPIDDPPHVAELKAKPERTAPWQRLALNGCQCEVPASWHLAPDGSAVTASDGSNLSLRMIHVQDWTMHRAQILDVFGLLRALHENSAHRLWFEIGTGERRQHFIDVPNGPTSCVGLLDIHGTAALRFEDAIRIATSIAAASPVTQLK
jgi:hypothetical protein